MALGDSYSAGYREGGNEPPSRTEIAALGRTKHAMLHYIPTIKSTEKKFADSSYRWHNTEQSAPDHFHTPPYDPRIAASSETTSPATAAEVSVERTPVANALNARRLTSPPREGAICERMPTWIPREPKLPKPQMA